MKRQKNETMREGIPCDQNNVTKAKDIISSKYYYLFGVLFKLMVL